MSYFYQKGETLDLTAPVGGVVAGVPTIVGGIVVVPETTAAEGETYAGTRVGVWSLPKRSGESWAAGGRVHWDHVAGVLTSDKGWPFFGFATEDAASADTAALALLVSPSGAGGPVQTLLEASGGTWPDGGSQINGTDTAAHAFTEQITIPADLVSVDADEAGQEIAITAAVLVDGVNGTPDLTAEVLIDGAAIATVTATAAAGKVAILEGVIRPRTAGASGTLDVFSKGTLDATVQTGGVKAASHDWTAASVLTVEGTFSAGHADNLATLIGFSAVYTREA